MSKVGIAASIVFFGSWVSSPATEIWTETFDKGVGRFDQTREQGESKFVWNPSTQQIDGEFERTGGGRLDRRYAELGQSFTHNDAVGFRIVLTPTDISPERSTAANIGFWNSNQPDMTTWVGVRIGLPAGILISGTDNNGGPIGLGNNSPFVGFTFGETYFIDFFSDGLGELTMDVYLGRDATGPLLGALSWTLEPDEVFDVNALGMGNPGAGSTTFWASIDDFSYVLGANALPDDLQVVRGRIASGELADVHSSDDTRLVVQPGITLNPDEPPVWLILEASAPTASPNALVFTLEAQVDTPGVTQRVELFNYMTQTFEQIDVREASFNEDSVAEIFVDGDPSRFVDAKSLGMRAQLTFKPGPLVLFFPWNVGIDEATWTVVP